MKVRYLIVVEWYFLAFASALNAADSSAAGCAEVGTWTFRFQVWPLTGRSPVLAKSARSPSVHSLAGAFAVVEIVYSLSAPGRTATSRRLVPRVVAISLPSRKTWYGAAPRTPGQDRSTNSELEAQAARAVVAEVPARVVPASVGPSSPAPFRTVKSVAAPVMWRSARGALPPSVRKRPWPALNR
ncbi:hypothetical protein ACMA1D_18970 [Streptomyces sp. 796.1]|uniref:hypothetical protein n=1 Tax=Streptomyces sp. 796.1 TaxID=3163029 RepID=UPI0039C9BC6C